MMGEADLSGYRILVAEDEYYQADDAVRALVSAGAEAMSPCATEQAARSALQQQRPDAVVLDINLGSGPTFKLAQTLTDQGIPFVFLTGYGQDMIPAEFAHVERFEKPVEMRDVVRAISRVVGKAADRPSLARSLDVLIRTATGGNEKVRAAFYIADASCTKLHHITGMSRAYAAHVDGFKIGPESLACGLAAATGHPILTADVTEEPLWKDWLWLAEKFDYRACWSFPIKTTEGKIVGTLAIYHREPREATSGDLDLANMLTRKGAIIISQREPRPDGV